MPGTKYGGGGGMGAGAGIFVRQGAQIFLEDCSFTGGEVQGGDGFDNGRGIENGQGIGEALFLAGPATYHVAAGDTVGIADSIGGGIDAQITGGFTKTGPGILILSASNNFTGGTVVEGGTLRINGDLSANNQPVTVRNSAVLAGRGRIAGPVTLEHTARLAPGVSPGALTVGEVIWNAGTFFDVEVDGVAGPGVSGGHDVLIVTTGQVTLGSANLNLDINGSLPNGEAFTIIDKQSPGPVSGTFSGRPEGSVFVVDGQSLKITYAGGDGNDVVISTPETPSLVVTTTNDVVDASDGQTSLREAIAYAATLTDPQIITFSDTTANGAVDFHTTTNTITLGGTQLLLDSDVTIDGPGADRLAISGNNASRVFQVGLARNVTLQDMTIRDGLIDDVGAGIYIQSANVTIQRCVFTHNTIPMLESEGQGGAIYITGVFAHSTVLIEDSTIANNAISGRSGWGAGIACNGSVNLVELTIRNSTISGNRISATQDSFTSKGAGIYARQATTLHLIHSTVTSNVITGLASSGGGIYKDSGATVNLAHSIVAGNTALGAGSGPDVFSSINSQGYNLIGNTSGSSGWVASDLVNTDPLLAPLADNGGPTPTHALLSGSPGIDAAVAYAGITYDQRGVSRPQGVAPDIGAFERELDPQTITFPAIPEQVTTNILGLAATASSGLPVTFAVGSGPAVLAGGTNLSFTGAGAVSVVASQEGNATYLAAPPVTNMFLVTKAMAAVTLTNLIQTYNGASRAVSTQTDPDGLNVVVTYDGSTNIPVNVGSYAVTGTVNDVMYQGEATGTLAIEKAEQNIDFPAIADQPVNGLVVLAATGGESGNPVTFAVASGPAIINAGTNLTFDNIGEVAIVASQAGSGNYLAATPVTNTFSVYAVAPAIGGPWASNVLARTATLGAEVTSSNGAPVIERGAVWGTVPAFTNAVGTYSESGIWGAEPFGFNVTGLVAGVTNHFRVYAVNSAGVRWTEESLFLTIPDAPATDPADTIVPDGFTAHWHAATGATNYFIDIAPTSDFSVIEAAYNNRSVGDVTSFSITGLTSRPNYYVRLRSQNAAGISTNSETREVAMLLPVIILGTPAERGAPAPLSYGTNLVLVGTVVTNSVLSPADELNGTRYVCTGFVGTGSAPLSGTNRSVTFTLTEPTTITWQWGTEHYLALSAINGGITNAVSGWKPEGWIYSLYPTNSPNALFVHWLTNGAVAGADNPHLVTMDAPMNVHAVFEEQRSLVSDQLQDWRMDPQFGWYTAGLEICNSASSTLPVVPPYRYVVPDNGRSGLLFPDGTDPATGHPYQDLTAKVSTALAGVGNGDANLDPGECVTVRGIIFYSTDRSIPSGTFSAAMVSVQQPPPAHVPDTDGDGLPDLYERQFEDLSENNPFDAAGDQDDDGMTTLDEYHADTDPFDPASLLRITGFGPDGLVAIGGRMVTQYLERSAALGDWTVVGTNHPPTTVTNLWVLPEDGSRSFYRITVPPRVP